MHCSLRLPSSQLSFFSSLDEYQVNENKEFFEWLLPNQNNRTREIAIANLGLISRYLRFLQFHALSLLIFFHNQLRMFSALENPLAPM
jgi:hypothetical protein